MDRLAGYVNTTGQNHWYVSHDLQTPFGIGLEQLVVAGEGIGEDLIKSVKTKESPFVEY